MVDKRKQDTMANSGFRIRSAHFDENEFYGNGTRSFQEYPFRHKRVKFYPDCDEEKCDYCNNGKPRIRTAVPNRSPEEGNYLPHSKQYTKFSSCDCVVHSALAQQRGNVNAKSLNSTYSEHIRSSANDARRSHSKGPVVERGERVKEIIRLLQETMKGNRCNNLQEDSTMKPCCTREHRNGINMKILNAFRKLKAKEKTRCDDSLGRENTKNCIGAWQRNFSYKKKPLQNIAKNCKRCTSPPCTPECEDIQCGEGEALVAGQFPNEYRHGGDCKNCRQCGRPIPRKYNLSSYDPNFSENWRPETLYRDIVNEEQHKDDRTESRRFQSRSIGISPDRMEKPQHTSKRFCTHGDRINTASKFSRNDAEEFERQPSSAAHRSGRRPIPGRKPLYHYDAFPYQASEHYCDLLTELEAKLASRRKSLRTSEFED